MSFKNCQFEMGHSVFVVLMLMPHDESNFKVRVPMIDLFHASRPKSLNLHATHVRQFWDDVN